MISSTLDLHFIFLYVAGLSTIVLGDLPVHCLHYQTVGKWVIHMGADFHDSTLTCGHQLPDSVMSMVKKRVTYENPNFEVAKKYIVDLHDPNVVVDEHGNKGWVVKLSG